MSNILATTLKNLTATKSAPVADVIDGYAKAWVNFNGTGTVAIRSSFNITSITDNGTGDYTLNFTTALADTNYAVVFGTQDDQTNTGQGSGAVGSIARRTGIQLTTSCRCVWAVANTGNPYDATTACAAVFR